jgi:hypothetical protein
MERNQLKRKLARYYGKRLSWLDVNA